MRGQAASWRWGRGCLWGVPRVVGRQAAVCAAPSCSRPAPLGRRFHGISTCALRCDAGHRAPRAQGWPGVACTRRQVQGEQHHAPCGVAARGLCPDPCACRAGAVALPCPQQRSCSVLWRECGGRPVDWAVPTCLQRKAGSGSAPFGRLPLCCRTPHPAPPTPLRPQPVTVTPATPPLLPVQGPQYVCLDVGSFVCTTCSGLL
jgi:hypothetical protein